jgi:chromosome segregation ATPase
MEALEIQIGQLQNRLSFEQSNNWNTRRENERLTSESYNLQGQLEVEKQEVRRLDDMLYDVEEKFEKLEAKYRQLKRRSRSRSEGRDYRRAYEEKATEVEGLRVRLAERDDLIRLDEARIAEKNRLLRERSTTITYLKNYLRTHGFRVED